jgi:hypothetical protein
MRSTSFVVLALVALPAAGVAQGAAQPSSRPSIVLTILAGAVTGHDLWAIPKQPRVVQGTANYDTLAMSRAIGSSLILGASGTYFLTQNVGVHAELSYLGLPLDSSCRLLPPKQADFEDKNQQICDNFHAEAGAGGAIAVFAGVTLRAASQRSFSPYLRGNVGLVSISRSTVEVIGAYVDGAGPQERQIVGDPSPRRRSLMLGLAAGFTTPLSPGYQVRVEFRDIITTLDRLTAPANDLAVAPIGSRTYHHLGLAIGLDIVLEKSRGRRY